MTHPIKFSEPQSACVYPPSWYQPPDQTPDGPVNPFDIQDPLTDISPNDVLAG